MDVLFLLSFLLVGNQFLVKQDCKHKHTHKHTNTHSLSHHTQNTVPHKSVRYPSQLSSS